MTRKLDINEYLIIGLVHYLIFSIFGFYLVRDYLHIPRNLNMIPKLLMYAWPLGIVSILGAFIPVMERSLAIDLLSSEIVGYYSAGFRIASIASLFIYAFQMGWGPFWLSIHKSKESMHIYNRVLRYYSVFIVILVFLISSTSTFIFDFLAPDRFSIGVLSILPVLMGFSVQSIAWILSIGISISKKTYIELIVQIFVLLMTIAILKTIGKFGLLGLAYSFLITRLFQSILLWKMGDFCYKLDWEYRRPVGFVLISMIFGICCSLVFINFGEFYFVLVNLLCLGVLSFIGYYFVFSLSDRAAVMLFKNRVINRITLSVK
jgi:O-antigen/teichoic acid export membrane protein